MDKYDNQPLRRSFEQDSNSTPFQQQTAPLPNQQYQQQQQQQQQQQPQQYGSSPSQQNYYNYQQQNSRVPNEVMQHAERLLQRQHMPIVNMTIALSAYLNIPNLFEIFCKQYPYIQIKVATTIFGWLTLACVIGMYGTTQRARWALSTYKNACPVFSVLLIFLAVYYFVSVGKDLVSYSAAVFSVILGIAFIALAIWLFLAFEMANRYCESVDWMKDSEVQERLSRLPGGAGAAGGAGGPKDSQSSQPNRPGNYDPNKISVGRIEDCFNE